VPVAISFGAAVLGRERAGDRLGVRRAWKAASAVISSAASGRSSMLENGQAASRR